MNTNVEMKCCRTCGASRPLTDYRRRRIRGGGYNSTCNACLALLPPRRPRGSGTAPRPRRKHAAAVTRTVALDNAGVALQTALCDRCKPVVKALLVLRGSR